jgi:hypothetical protein
MRARFDQRDKPSDDHPVKEQIKWQLLNLDLYGRDRTQSTSTGNRRRPQYKKKSHGSLIEH